MSRPCGSIFGKILEELDLRDRERDLCVPFLMAIEEGPAPAPGCAIQITTKSVKASKEDDLLMNIYRPKDGNLLFDEVHSQRQTWVGA